MKLKCVMLIDDDGDDNFIHERAIIKSDQDTVVIIRDSAEKALEYIGAGEEPHADLIFLDINMPGMNGWEFLQKYNLLDQNLKSNAIVIMLSTSDYSADIARSRTWDCVCDFITKPLTAETMKAITLKYFPES